MKDPARLKFDALGSLMVLIYHHGKNDIKWSWANDPKKDGLRTFFHTAVGYFDEYHIVSLKNKALWLADNFEREFHTTVERTAPNGEKFRQRVVVEEKASDEQLLETYWLSMKPTAEEILSRLKNMDDDQYRNMKSYYDLACSAFEPANKQPTQKPDAPGI